MTDDFNSFSELNESQLQAVEKAKSLAMAGKYVEAAECIIPSTASTDPEPTRMVILYYTMANQYDKVIEWCKKVDSIEGHLYSLLSWVRRILGQCYEEGLGVEKDLIQAFRWYDMACCVNDVSDQYLKERDEFLHRHPELKELPEVQSALAPLDDDNDY